MPRYSNTVLAPANTAANTEDIYIEISGEHKVVSIEARIGSGANVAPGLDNDFVVRFYNTTAAGSGGTTSNTAMNGTSKFISTNATELTNFVALKMPLDQRARAASTTVTAKSNTTNFTGGAGTNTLKYQWVMNGREKLTWIARDDATFFSTAGLSCITVASAVVSQKVLVIVVHEE